MKLFISNYASSGGFERAGVKRRVRISRGKDRLGRFDVSILELAPSRSLLEGFRRGRLSLRDYDSRFWEEVEPNWASATKGMREGDCLLCFCAGGSHCHRYLVADRLRSEGHDVTEI